MCTVAATWCADAEPLVETRPEPAPDAAACVATWLEELPAEEATLGEEVPLEAVPLERCSSMNHVAISIASASRATSAIWKGREIWAINSNFGIRAARVEPQIGRWTAPTGVEHNADRSRRPGLMTWRASGPRGRSGRIWA